MNNKIHLGIHYLEYYYKNALPHIYNTWLQISVRRLFHLSLRPITFGGRPAHLAHIVYKAARFTYLHTRTQAHVQKLIVAQVQSCG